MTDAAEPEITGTPTAWDRVKLARETDRPTPGITSPSCSRTSSSTTATASSATTAR